MYVTSMTDKAKMKDLFHKAMEIWLPELPDIQLTQFYHSIPMNTEHWTGWPTRGQPLRQRRLLAPDLATSPQAN